MSILPSCAMLMELDDRERQMRFLVRDRDTKFPRALDSLLASDTVKVVRTPTRAPNANTPHGALGRHRPPRVPRPAADRRPPPARNVLRVYVQHYNRQRPHRALDLKPPDANARSSTVGAYWRTEDLQVRRRDLLGRVIHEYELAAAT